MVRSIWSLSLNRKPRLVPQRLQNGRLNLEVPAVIRFARFEDGTRRSDGVGSALDCHGRKVRLIRVAEVLVDVVTTVSLTMNSATL